jgi:outer membrane protein assembly factor BamB
MKSRLIGFAVLAAAVAFVGCGKPPLAPGKPAGPTLWMRGAAAACSTSTTDPSGVQVSYQFDWGDNSKSAWSPYLDGGVVWADTHSYTEQGDYSITVRARNTKKASAWSEPLDITVSVGEGEVLWSLAYTDPEDPEDSSDFSLNTFALGSDSTAYIACDYGAVVARKTTGSTWRFITPGGDAFSAAPVVGTDGTIYIGCSNDTIYALNPNGTRKWVYPAGEPVSATGALGADGTIYFQAEDSLLLALNPNGTRKWAFYSHGGNSSPVVAADGTIYVANGDGQVYAVDPAMGTAKWSSPYSVSSTAINASPAIDPSRNVVYVADDDGRFAVVDFNGSGAWGFLVGDAPSSPVIGTDGTIYIGGGGNLHALLPDGQRKWLFTPTLAGTVSPPAISADGYVYVLVTPGKKKSKTEYRDSLYAVNVADGTRHWACGLGQGLSDVFMSAPKIDAAGRIYIGDGMRGWCVQGKGGPDASVWPVFQHDLVNSGRAQ